MLFVALTASIFSDWTKKILQLNKFVILKVQVSINFQACFNRIASLLIIILIICNPLIAYLWSKYTHYKTISFSTNKTERPITNYKKIENTKAELLSYKIQKYIHYQFILQYIVTMATTKPFQPTITCVEQKNRNKGLLDPP